MHNKKFFSAIVALLVSVGLWVYVVTVENPVKDLELHNIPVTFYGQEILQEDYSLMITDNNAESGVTLVFSGKMSDLRKLQDGRSEIQVTVSVNHLRNAQEYHLSYDIADVNLPGDVSSTDVTLSHKNQTTVSLSLEKLSKKTIQVRVVNNVETEAGFTTGRLSQNYSELVIQGPEELVNQVEYAQVIVERENANQSINATLPFAFVDINGEIVDSTKLICPVNEIEVSVPVLMYKDVPLEIPVTEGGGALEADCEITIHPQVVRLSGDPSDLESVNSIKLSGINLSTLMTNSETFTRSIVIPQGCTSISGETEADVSIEIKNKAITSLRIPSSNFQFIGVPDDMTVVFNTVMLKVTIRANESDIEKIQPENVRVVADFSAYTLGTSMKVPVTIRIDGFEGAGPIGEEAYTVDADVISVDDVTQPEA